MKKTLIALATVGILFGCSTDPTDHLSHDRPAPAKVTPAPETGDPGLTEEETDEVFLNVLADEDSRFADPEAGQAVIELAHKTCDAFDAGVSFEQAASILVDSGFEPYLAGFIIGAGTAAYCPEHSNLIEDSAGV